MKIVALSFSEVLRLVTTHQQLHYQQLDTMLLETKANIEIGIVAVNWQALALAFS